MLLFGGNLSSNGLNSFLRLRDFDFIIRAEPHGSTEETPSEEEVSMDGCLVRRGSLSEKDGGFFSALVQLSLLP